MGHGTELNAYIHSTIPSRDGRDLPVYMGHKVFAPCVLQYQRGRLMFIVLLQIIIGVLAVAILINIIGRMFKRVDTEDED